MVINKALVRFPLATTDPRRRSILSISVNDQPGDKPRVYSATLPDGLQIQHAWRPVFRDTDGDGRSEVWVRYNATAADGFRQVLEVYRIDSGENLALEKRFTGDCEGIARLLEDGTVEVASGSTVSGAGHLDFEEHRVERWSYVKHAWRKVDSKGIPHLLWGEDWRKYYDLDEPR